MHRLGKLLVLLLLVEQDLLVEMVLATEVVGSV